MNFSHLPISIICVTFLSCNDGKQLESNLVEYQNRLGNVLEVESPEFMKMTLSPYPSRNSLRQSIPITTIKLSEFYNLKDCQVYSLVAERNTSLGHVHLPSTRYLYERNLLTSLSECINQTKDTHLLEKLKEWRTAKYDALPNVWANLIQLSSETQHAFSSNQRHITGNETDGLSQTMEALIFLSNLNLKTEVSAAQLESHLQNLMHFALPAKLWLSQLLLKQYLSQSTEWLQHHKDKISCPNGSPGKKAKYLVNVFRMFFIEKIQPIAGKVNHYQYQLSPILKKFMEHSSLSNSFKQRLHDLNREGFSQYQQAMKQHISFWQSTFKRCNIVPGKRKTH